MALGPGRQRGVQGGDLIAPADEHGAEHRADVGLGRPAGRRRLHSRPRQWPPIRCRWREGRRFVRLGCLVGFPGQLVQPPALREALEGERAPGDQRQVRIGRRQVPDDLCDQDLARLGLGHDAGCGVHGDPLQVVPLSHDLAGVEAHPDLHRRFGVPPPLPLEGLLDGPGAVEPVAGGAEDDHEPVAQPFDDLAAVGRDLGPDDLVMDVERLLGDAVTLAAAQRGGPFDVGEEDGDDSLGDVPQPTRPPVSLRYEPPSPVQRRRPRATGAPAATRSPLSEVQARDGPADHQLLDLLGALEEVVDPERVFADVRRCALIRDMFHAGVPPNAPLSGQL